MQFAADMHFATKTVQPIGGLIQGDEPLKRIASGRRSKHGFQLEPEATPLFDN
jgi:hypothetical protein